MNILRAILAFALGIVVTAGAADCTHEGSYQGLGAGSISPETITRFAPPPLDHSLSQRIQRMMDVRGMESGLFTSDCKQMLFNWRVTGSSQVWKMDGPQRYPVQLTGGEDTTAVLAIAPNDQWFVVSRDVGGEENPGLYWMDIRGGELHEILHKNKVQTQLAFIADDNRKIYYTANDIDASSYAIYCFDKLTNQRALVFSEPGLWSVEDYGADRLLLSKSLGSDQIEFYEYSLTSKALKPLFGQNEKVRYSAAFAANPNAYIVRHDKRGEFFRLYEWIGGKERPITPESSADVDSFSIDHSRTRVTYTINSKGYLSLHALDARSYKQLSIPALPTAENVYGGVMSQDGRYMSVGMNSATIPRTYVMYDWQQHKVTPWRAISTPEVDVSKFTRATLQSYPARDGTAIPMFVWRSPVCEQTLCPVVVDFHGGPESQAHADFSIEAQLYVDAGFIFVQPNVRGSDGYGKTWLDADNGAKRLDVISDIEDAALYIKKAFAHNGMAPKVGVTGGSYGGYATLMAMTYFAGTYDAGVSEVGIANLLTFLENTAPYRRALRVSEYGDPVKDRDALIKLSATTYIDRVNAPLMIIQGVNDPRVPVGEALMMQSALETRGIPSQLILFADEGHGTRKRGNRVLAMGHTLEFFEKHLQGR